jgi:hypothetical protein
MRYHNTSNVKNFFYLWSKGVQLAKLLIIEGIRLVKHSAAAFLVAACALAQTQAMARPLESTGIEELQHRDESLLQHWDPADLLAQQDTTAPTQPVSPAPVTPTTTPVTPPAASADVAPSPTTEPAPDAPPPAVGEDPATEPLPSEEELPASEDALPEDEFSIGDIPVVETVEMTLEKAKSGLDVYIMVREKYKDSPLENYENLQDFVDKDTQGKAFETDVKAAGFPNVTEWNTLVTTLSFAYDNSVVDDTAEIQKQIAELEADTEMAQDMRERMIKALRAMIPSDNNKKVVADLKADPAYSEKIKLLTSEEETE